MKFKKKPEIFYLSYDGLLEPLGQSQILPYIIQMSSKYKFTIITLEKRELVKSKIDTSTTKSLKIKKIKWIKLNYFKKKLLFLNFVNILIINFYLLIKIITNKNNVIFHLRSYIPFFYFLIPIFFFKINYVFDMRGFWPQEKIDRKGWSNQSYIIKFLIFFEKIIINYAKKIICLTNESIEILLEKYPKTNLKQFICIRTAVDQYKFVYLKKKINLSKIIFGYLGTTDGAYNLHKSVSIFLKFKKYLPQSKIHIISMDNQYKIRKILKDLKIEENDYKIIKVDHKKVNEEINKIDLGIFYLEENLSVKASFPTKIAEFFICNKPIICNHFNKDIGAIIDFNKGMIIGYNTNVNKKEINNLKSILLKNYNFDYCRNYALHNLTVLNMIKNIYSCYK